MLREAKGLTEFLPDPAVPVFCLTSLSGVVNCDGESLDLLGICSKLMFLKWNYLVLIELGYGFGRVFKVGKLGFLDMRLSLSIGRILVNFGGSCIVGVGCLSSVDANPLDLEPVL